MPRACKPASPFRYFNSSPEVTVLGASEGGVGKGAAHNGRTAFLLRHQSRSVRTAKRLSPYR
jgi:hypothetical protein